MEFCSLYGPTKDEFQRRKRKRWVEWEFLASGEWSESPFHTGRVKFYFSQTARGDHWALMDRCGRARIICVASLDAEERKLPREEILGKMVRWLRENRGPYIEMIYRESRNLNARRILAWR